MSKELKVRKRTDGMYEIYFDGGGSIPAVLEGAFTHSSVAQQHLAAFQAGVREKAGDNAQVRKAQAQA